MQTRLILIRHGETDDNVARRIAGWRESELTELGLVQARRAAEFVAATYHPEAILTSPAKRARLTAEPLARSLGLRPVVLEGLRELHFGEVEGWTLDEMKERLPEVLRRTLDDTDLDFGWPGGETRRAFYERIRRTFDEIVAAQAGHTVAVVTHGGFVSSLLADLAEGKPAAWRRYDSANCSVAEIVRGDGGCSIACWNLTEHLRS